MKGNKGGEVESRKGEVTTLNGIIELLGDLITSYMVRDFEEEQVKVAYIGPATRIYVEDDYVELVRGSEYTVPRWVAQILQEKNRAKISESPVDEVLVTRIYFNESRSRGQLKFEKLSGYFYSRIRQQLITLLKAYKDIEDFSKAHQVFQAITNLATSTKNLYKVRLAKILGLIGSEVGPDVLANLSEEEKHLYVALRTILDIFNQRVFEVERRG